MSLQIKIKEDSVTARKERSDAVKISLLVTLLGEVVKIGKDAGNRDTTDAEASAVIKKFVKNLQEVTKYGNAEQKATADRELEILSQYLPKQLSNDELSGIIQEQIVAAGNSGLGPIMRFLKTNYDGQYDGAQAKSVFEALVTFKP